MKRCKTCKHWDKLYGISYGKCDKVAHVKDNSPTHVANRMNEADCIGNDDMMQEASDEGFLWDECGSPAVLEDGSGYYAALVAKEDFGCVLHEEVER